MSGEEGHMQSIFNERNNPASSYFFTDIADSGFPKEIFIILNCRGQASITCNTCFWERGIMLDLGDFN